MTSHNFKVDITFENQDQYKKLPKSVSSTLDWEPRKYPYDMKIRITSPEQFDDLLTFLQKEGMTYYPTDLKMYHLYRDIIDGNIDHPINKCMDDEMLSFHSVKVSNVKVN